MTIENCAKAQNIFKFKGISSTPVINMCPRFANVLNQSNVSNLQPCLLPLNRNWYFDCLYIIKMLKFQKYVVNVVLYLKLLLKMKFPLEILHLVSILVNFRPNKNT